MFATTLNVLGRTGEHGPRFVFPLFLLLFLGGIAALVVRRKRGGGGRHLAMHTLQHRFASGQIDRAEFEHRSAVLKGADTIPPAPARPAPPAADVPSDAPSQETDAGDAPDDSGNDA